MASYSDVFKRKEMKFLIDADQRLRLEDGFRANLVPSEFGRSQVRSLYYDTPEFALIERSLDKPIYKEKLRLRTYGEPASDAQAFVEIKKKFKGIVYKRRVSMSLAAAEAYLSGMRYEDACRTFPLKDAESAAQSLSPRSLQISREIDFMLERNEGIAPSMLIKCERTAFEDSSESDLRITFDDNLEFARNSENIRIDSGFEPIIANDLSIMEVKSFGPLPLWVVGALDSVEARPGSFSKYGCAYILAMKEKVA